MWVVANAAVSLEISERGTESERLEKGRSSNGSHMSRDSGSKMLVLRPKKLLGIRDIFVFLSEKERDQQFSSELVRMLGKWIICRVDGVKGENVRIYRKLSEF